MEIELTQKQNKEYKEAMLNGGEVSFIVDGLKAYTFSIVEEQGKSNLPGTKRKKSLLHTYEKHPVFDLHIKSLYRHIKEL